MEAAGRRVAWARSSRQKSGVRKKRERAASHRERAASQQPARSTIWGVLMIDPFTF